MAKTLSKDARLQRMYRHRPSIWYKHHFDRALLKYRNRTDLENFLERTKRRYIDDCAARKVEPNDRDVPHRWAWQKLKAGELRLDSTKSYQAEILDLIAKPIREGKKHFVHRLAFKMANGTTKTALASLAALWCNDCFPGSRIVTTAGTWSQLREQLWREIASWTDLATSPIIAKHVGVDKTQIDVAPDWGAFGRAAKSESTFEGVHGPVVMVIVDEAKAVKREVIENAIRRITRGHGRYFVLLLSSPGSPSGYFYDVCTAQSDRWHVLSMSAYESSAIPLSQIHDDYLEMGQDAPLFVVMNLGEFPMQGGRNVIPLSYVQAAVNRPVRGWNPDDGFDDDFEYPWRTAGCDVSRKGGDETSIVDMIGRRATLRETWSTFTRTNFVSGRLHDLWADYGYEVIGVDDTGVGGGVSDDLVALGIPIDEINFGENARQFPDKYYNLKSEIWFFLQAEFQAGFDHWDNLDCGLSIPNDKRLIHQLTMLEYTYDERQRRWVDGHKKVTEKGERSPDRADALAMANYVRSLAGDHHLVGFGDHKLY